MPQSESLQQLNVSTMVSATLTDFYRVFVPSQTRSATGSLALVIISALLLLGPLIYTDSQAAKPCHEQSNNERARAEQQLVRFATFNTALHRRAADQLVADLGSGKDQQILAIAEIIRTVRPDVLLVNEFDFDPGSRALELLRKNYLEDVTQTTEPLHYPHAFLAPANTGLDSGFDLDNDGRKGGPGDAYGYGAFPGQYAMLLLSRYPIEKSEVRTFQNFLWKDMPNALLPPNWYTTEELDAVRLSSKSHWDVPIRINHGNRIHTTHVLASHPVPPVFDGPEDRNGRRNHDEIRLFSDYIGDSNESRYIYDDDGLHGGIKSEYDSFIVMGDLNADPVDGDSLNNASRQLIDHIEINDDTTPSSDHAISASRRQGGVNDRQQGDPRLDTGDFNDKRPGNLRVDYILPSKRGITVVCAGVLWPDHGDADATRLNKAVIDASDHRLVYMDIRFQE